MAERSYGVRSSLNQTFLDHEIALTSKTISFRPIALKVILFYLVSFLMMLWVVLLTPVKSADWWCIALVILWWALMTWYLGQYSAAKELQFVRVKALAEYLPKMSRWVRTRRGDNPSGFSSIVGISRIDDNGFIHYTDGTFGQMYLVVGSASSLLFAQDREQILDRVDKFWRKIDTNVEIITMTMKEPQRVYHQEANLARRAARLRQNSPELRDLLQEQYTLLHEEVGQNFTSIHQYFIVKGDVAEAVRHTHKLLQAEALESGLMIRQMTMLGKADTLATLGVLYRGRTW